MNGRKLWVQRLLPMIVLVWAFLLLRLINIEGWNAYFIDEVAHMNRAQEVLKFTDLQTSTTPGKFLLYYYLSVFHLPQHEPIWLARTAVAVFSMSGLAAAYGLGRQLFSHRVALLAVVILVVFPMTSFHERQVLSDPLASSTATLVLWWSVIVAKRPTLPRASVLGVFVCLMLAAKVIALPLLVAPFLAVALFSPLRLQPQHRLWPQVQHLWRAYWPYIRRSATIILAVWIPIMLVYQIRFTFFPDTASPIVVDYIYAGLVDDYNETTQDVIEANLAHIQEMFSRFWGLLLLIPSAIGIGYTVLRQPRTTVFILLSVAIIWGPLIIIAARPNTRYYMVLGPALIVLVAGGLLLLIDDLKRYPIGRLVAAVPMVSLIGWVALYALPFNLQLADDVTQLTLPEKDSDGYFRRYTSHGLYDGLMQAVESGPLDENQEVTTVFVINAFCGSMSYLYPEGTPLVYRCPKQYDPEKTTRLASVSEDLRKVLAHDGSVYMIHDRLSALNVNDLDIPASIEYITTYQRPFNGNYVDLYRVIIDNPTIKANHGQD